MTSADARPESADRRAPTLRVISRAVETAFALDEPELLLGRSSSAHLRIDSEAVSGIHARLVRAGETYRYIHVGATNPTLLAGAAIADHLLRPGDRLEIAPGTPLGVTLIFEQADGDDLRGTLQLTRPFRTTDVRGAQHVERLALPASGTLSVGRSSSNDLVLPSLSVSRAHARLSVADGVVTLVDLDSANGTFVNGVQVRSRRLAAGDIIRIGPYKLAYRDHVVQLHDDSRSVRLDVHGVTKVVGGRTILSGVTFTARPGQVLAIAGTSGAGKSTLIDALNGMRPPTSGHILVNGADLYRAFESLRPLIGYVPQESILPRQLPVQRALRYVARLRLPPDVGGKAVDERIEEVMRQLGIDHRRDVAIGQLSGGQQKRASIAAELIARPGLFFLDEPTSGLDPGLTRRVTRIIRDLAEAGSTIVLISHDVESLQASDRIVVLASGGHVVFIGTPGEALMYFDIDELAQVYDRVEAEDPVALEERFRASLHYREHVADELAADAAGPGGVAAPVRWDPIALIGAGARRGASTWRQFRIATTRYAESTLRDRKNLALLLLQAPIIAFFLALIARGSDFHPPPAVAVEQATRLGVPAAKLAAPLPVMLAASATWFGAINAAREIVKELPVLRRERLAGLRVAPYLASKVVVLAVLCLVQTGLLLGIVWTKVSLPHDGRILSGPLELWITLDLAAFAALGLGLLISASMSNADRAQSLVPIVLIPQLIFIGGPGTGVAGKWLSYLTVTHWSVEAMKITAEIPYRTTPGGFGASDLLLHWGALLLMGTVFLALSAWQLGRQGRV